MYLKHTTLADISIHIYMCVSIALQKVDSLLKVYSMICVRYGSVDSIQDLLDSWKGPYCIFVFVCVYVCTCVYLAMRERYCAQL